MKITKRIICLANSRKLSGRCVAGREWLNNAPAAWVRPVSIREHQEVSEYERQYCNGSDPCVRDIIDVPLLNACPKDYQQENWLLDPELYWTKVGHASWQDLEQLEEPDGCLWLDGWKTYHGVNDCIPYAQALTLQSSLRLIRVNQLKLVTFAPGEAFGNSKRRVQANFRHVGVNYSLWVTDPQYETTYLAQADGEHNLGESFLTISVGEPYKDSCYKLVAAIIERAAEAHT